MRELLDLFSHAVLWVGLFGLVALAAFGVFALCKDAWNIYRQSKNLLIMIPLAIGAIIVGGTKPSTPTAQVYWDEGLRDAGTAIDTNDLRQITFKWSYEDWVPPVATVSGYAWDKTAGGVPTDFEGSIPIFSGVPVTDGQATVLMESDATNYVFYVEQSYIPDAPVVTNGVYHIHAVGTNKVWIPIGLTIKEESRIISPHKEKQ